MVCGIRSEFAAVLTICDQLMSRWDPRSNVLLLLLEKPHTDGSVSQKGPAAHVRAQSSLSSTEGEGWFLTPCCMLQWWEDFSSDCFSESVLVVLITEPGAALWAHCGSWEKAARLILTTHKKHTHGVHAPARLGRRNQSVGCAVTLLRSTTWAPRHQRPELVQIHFPPSQDQQTAETVLLPDLRETFYAGSRSRAGSRTRSWCVCRRRRWKTLNRSAKARKRHGCGR